MRLLTFFYVSSANWFCEKCEPKAIEAVKMDKLVEEKCEKCFNNFNVRMMKLEKEMSTRASSDDVDALLCRCIVLENEVATLGDVLKSNQGSTEAGLIGKIYAQVGENKASVIANLVKNTRDQLKREEKQMEVRKKKFILYNITELKS